MVDDQPDPIVIDGSKIECEEGCGVGSFKWILVNDLKEMLEWVSPEDREGLEHFLSVTAHNLLGNIAHAAMLYAIDDDGSAFEAAEEALYNMTIELNARFGVIEMEAALANSSDPDVDPDVP